MTDFGFTATSLFEIWTPARSSTSTSRSPKGLFSFSWRNGSLSLSFGPFFFSFFTKDFLPLLIFPWANIFPKSKSFHVWILSNARCKQNMQITWKTRPKMSLPQGIRSWTRLRHLPDLLTLVWKYVFLINVGVLKISEFFLRKRKVKCLNSV